MNKSEGHFQLTNQKDILAFKGNQNYISPDNISVYFDDSEISEKVSHIIVQIKPKRHIIIKDRIAAYDLDSLDLCIFYEFNELLQKYQKESISYKRKSIVSIANQWKLTIYFRNTFGSNYTYEFTQVKNHQINFPHKHLEGIPSGTALFLPINYPNEIKYYKEVCLEHHMDLTVPLLMIENSQDIQAEFLFTDLHTGIHITLVEFIYDIIDCNSELNFSYNGETLTLVSKVISHRTSSRYSQLDNFHCMTVFIRFSQDYQVIHCRYYFKLDIMKAILDLNDNL